MSNETDDEDLALRMMCGEADALREVLRRHLEPVREVLDGKYRTTVQHADLDEAVNRAIYTMWNKAGEYDSSKGTLRAWFFAIAQRAVLDIYRRERRHRRKHPLLDVDSDVSDESDSATDEPASREEKKELQDLDYVVEHKLKGHQQFIIKADLANGFPADAGSLAEQLDTTKDSIYVSRHKAHDNIHKEMTQLAQSRERMRGKK